MNALIPFEWILAVRFLQQGRVQTFLTIIGASVGVAVIVFMSALLTGVQQNIFNRVLSGQAQIVLTSPEEVARSLANPNAVVEIPIVQKSAQRLKSIDQWQSIATQLASKPDIAAIAPTATGTGLALRGDATKAISLNGIVPESYYRIIDIPDKMVRGTAQISTGDVLIGTELADDLGVGLSEKFRIRTSRGQGSTLDETFTIRGIFDMANRDINERTVYIPLRAAQTLLELPGGVTHLSLNLKDPYQAERVAGQIRATFDLDVESWITRFTDLFNALRSQTIANFSIRFFVAVAVTLGIASVLVVSVVQRSHEIGILRAMGASRGQVLRLFLLQGAIVGLLSSLMGSALGAGFVMVWRLFARKPDGTEFFSISLPISLFVATSIVATLTGLVASILPAIGAARLNPVDAIRG